MVVDLIMRGKSIVDKSRTRRRGRGLLRPPDLVRLLDHRASIFSPDWGPTPTRTDTDHLPMSLLPRDRSVEFWTAIARIACVDSSIRCFYKEALARRVMLSYFYSCPWRSSDAAAWFRCALLLHLRFLFYFICSNCTPPENDDPYPLSSWMMKDESNYDPEAFGYFNPARRVVDVSFEFYANINIRC